ncbi:hypothetical protein ACOSP7_006971 [Xanthoceras sorbifolium]
MEPSPPPRPIDPIDRALPAPVTLSSVSPLISVNRTANGLDARSQGPYSAGIAPPSSGFETEHSWYKCLR